MRHFAGYITATYEPATIIEMLSPHMKIQLFPSPHLKVVGNPGKMVVHGHSRTLGISVIFFSSRWSATVRTPLFRRILPNIHQERGTVQRVSAQCVVVRFIEFESIRAAPAGASPFPPGSVNFCANQHWTGRGLLG